MTGSESLRLAGLWKDMNCLQGAMGDRINITACAWSSTYGYQVTANRFPGLDAVCTQKGCILIVHLGISKFLRASANICKGLETMEDVE